jgi:hypothetical protein
MPIRDLWLALFRRSMIPGNVGRQLLRNIVLIAIVYLPVFVGLLPFEGAVYQGAPKNIDIVRAVSDGLFIYFALLPSLIVGAIIYTFAIYLVPVRWRISHPRLVTIFLSFLVPGAVIIFNLPWALLFRTRVATIVASLAYGCFARAPVAEKDT